MHNFFGFIGITESMFRLKPTDEIVEQAKKYVPRQRVTVKKAKQKEQPPAGETSEHETDPENDEDEGENIIYVFCVILYFNVHWDKCEHCHKYNST